MRDNMVKEKVLDAVQIARVGFSMYSSFLVLLTIVAGIVALFLK